MKNKILLLSLLVLFSTITNCTADVGSFVEYAKNGNINKVKECIENGVDIETRNDAGFTALMEASSYGHIRVVQYLVEKNSNVNAYIKDDSTTVLMVAAVNNKLKVVQYSLENNANINAKDSTGNAALAYASNNGHLDVVKVLVEKGADIYSKDDEGWTALD